MTRHWHADDLEAHLAAERMEKRRMTRLEWTPTCDACGREGIDRDEVLCSSCKPKPRLDLVAHIREQIAADPHAYANDRKLEAVADAYMRSEAERDVCPHGIPHHDCTEHNTKETE